MSSYVLLGSRCQKRNQLLGNDEFPVKNVALSSDKVVYVCVCLLDLFY